MAASTTDNHSRISEILNAERIKQHLKCFFMLLAKQLKWQIHTARTSVQVLRCGRRTLVSVGHWLVMPGSRGQGCRHQPVLLQKCSSCTWHCWALTIFQLPEIAQQDTPLPTSTKEKSWNGEQRNLRTISYVPSTDSLAPPYLPHQSISLTRLCKEGVNEYTALFSLDKRYKTGLRQGCQHPASLQGFYR